MKFSKLGFSNIKVSKICLGTMTFENKIPRGVFEIMDYANEKGEFFDTVKMYPSYPKKLMVCQKRLR